MFLRQCRARRFTKKERGEQLFVGYPFRTIRKGHFRSSTCRHVLRLTYTARCGCVKTVIGHVDEPVAARVARHVATRELWLGAWLRANYETHTSFI